MQLANLSTRPFYNVRAVRAILGALALLVVAVTLYNAVQIVRLAGQQRSLGAQAAQQEAEASRLRSDAAAISARIDPRELSTVAGEARSANAIIDRRTFSWTDLFTEFEVTLPPDVRITAVQPRLDRGTFVVSIQAEARRAEDLDAFIEALEQRGAFSHVLPVEESTTEQGNLQAVIQGVYTPTPRDSGATAQPASTQPASTPPQSQPRGAGE